MSNIFEDKQLVVNLDRESCGSALLDRIRRLGVSSICIRGNQTSFSGILATLQADGVHVAVAA